MTPDPVTVAHDAPLSEALGLMRAREIHELPVLRGRRLIGLLTFESIARRANLPLSTKAEHLLILPPLVSPATTLPEIAEQLLAAAIRAAPVVGRRGELKGIVSRTDLVQALASNLGSSRQPVDEIARSIGATIRDTDPMRSILTRVRLLEEHPLPVVDRKGQLVGAVGISDLGRVLWRPTIGGKRDASRGGSVGDVEVRTIMHSPAVIVPEGATTTEAARRMTREGVSSVFVVDRAGRPTSVVSQTDLLGLAIGARGTEGAALGDVYVEVTGLRGASDPSILTEIDRAVAKGLRRIARYAKPLLINLHFAPHATHRGGDVSIEARLHTDHGIFYASNSGWNFLLGTTGLMDELLAQVRRHHEEARRPRRGGRGSSAKGPVETLRVDDDLETRIRAATDLEDER
ncbi:MAG: CBS domain-containing protein [Thermoplasmata archaeon]